MADIEYDFAADATAAERAIARLEQKTERLENQLKQNARTSRQGASQFQTDALRMVGGLVSVSTAVAVATRGYEEWRRKIDGARQAAEDFNKDLVTQLALTGDLAQGRGIRAFLQGIPGATREQGEAAFGGISGGAPGLPLARRLELTKDLTRIAPLVTSVDKEGKLVGEQDLQKLGTLQGRIAELAGEGVTADDITDLTLAASQLAGDRVAQLSSAGVQRLVGTLRGQGVSLERSLAIALESTTAGIEAGTFSGIVAKAEDKGLTIDQLLSDPALAKKTLGSEQRTALNLLNLKDINELENKFVTAQTGDLARQAISDLVRVDPLRVLEQQTAAQRQQQNIALGDDERARAALVESQRVQEGQQTIGSGLLFGFGRRAEETAGFGRSLLTGEAAPTNLELATERLQPSFTNAHGPLSVEIKPGPVDAEQLRMADETNTLLREISDTLKVQNAPPPPRNVNRNAHTE